jgi:hypothetical protein
MRGECGKRETFRIGAKRCGGGHTLRDTGGGGQLDARTQAFDSGEQNVLSHGDYRERRFAIRGGPDCLQESGGIGRNSLCVWGYASCVGDPGQFFRSWPTIG